MRGCERPYVRTLQRRQGEVAKSAASHLIINYSSYQQGHENIRIALNDTYNLHSCFERIFDEFGYGHSNFDGIVDPDWQNVSERHLA